MVRNNHTLLSEMHKCSCGNSFTYYQGILNDYCSDHFASEYSFISDIVEFGNCDIIVGESLTISFKKDVPLINKILLTPCEGIFYVEPSIYRDSKSFKVISSEITENLNFYKDSIVKQGQKAKVFWFVYGKTKEIKLEPWRHLLIYSKEQKIAKNYLLSFLCSAIALESFINTKIAENLSNTGLNQASIEIFLKESTMPDKIFNLSKALLGIKFPLGMVTAKKIQDIIIKRNKIAHGKITDIDSETAKDTFKIVITYIFENHVINKNVA